MLARVILGPELAKRLHERQRYGMTFKNGAQNEWNEDRSPNHQSLGGKMGKEAMA